MDIKLVRKLFLSQMGHTTKITYIELPPKNIPDVPMVKTINHWKLAELIDSHTYDKKDQSFSLPKLRRKK